MITTKKRTDHANPESGAKMGERPMAKALQSKRLMQQQPNSHCGIAAAQAGLQLSQRIK